MTLFATFPIINSLSSAEAATSVASTTTLNMTLGYTSANLDLVVRDSSGTFASSADSQLAKFGVTTNNHSGYILTILGSDNNGQLSNTTAGASLNSITSAVNDSVFNTSVYNGKWGYKPNKFGSVENNSYRPAPTTIASTLDQTTSSNSEANNYSIGLGARVDYTSPTGTYTNTYSLAAVANPTPYTISFNDNTADTTVTNIPPLITGEANSTIVTLPNKTPLRTGYTFNGWCESAPTINADGSTTCSTATIAAGADYDFINQTTNTNNVNLYTTWTINHYNLSVEFSGGGVSNVKVCKTAGNCTGSNLVGTITTSGSSVEDLPFNTTYYLYPTFISSFGLAYWSNIGEYGMLSCVAGDTCAVTINPSFLIKAGDGAVRLTTEATSATMQTLPAAACTATAIDVPDIRDGQSYTVQRLEDGNCWMMTNLNLGDTANYPLLDNLTSDNTNLASTVSAATFLGWKKTSGTGTYTTAEYISISGTDSTANAPYGTLYNYCAASAGTICASSNSSNATYDLCPKGWRLPTGGDNSEFTNLYAQPAYNTYAKMRASVANGGAAFTIPGYFISGAPVNQGINANYWSSTWAGDNISMHRMNVNSSPGSIQMVASGYRDRGHSIRCVHKELFTDLKAGVLTMQEIGNLSNAEKIELYSKMEAITSYTVKDSRDGQSYTIAKLADGNIWTSNMNLGAVTLTTDLTSENTNLATTISATTFNGWKKTSGSATYTAGEFIPVSGTDSTASSPYGTLYNYCAASAGTICISSNYQNATYDICPKGWRMPTGGTNGEFQGLYNAGYNTLAKIRASIVNGGAAFAAAGYFDSSSPQLKETYNGTVSSTSLSNATISMSTYNASSESFVPLNGHSRSDGYSVRCVLKDLDISGATYMQDMTSTMVANTATGTTKTLIDNRDNQRYTVAKMADGRLWMTRNLAIGCNGTGNTYGSSMSSKSLTSADSNVSTTWSTPTALLSFASSSTQTADYSTPRIQCSSSYGAWYNYATATAGTTTGDSNTVAATYDICPKSWKLPAIDEFSSITNYVNNFNVVTGGYYDNGSIIQSELGRWWSTTAYNALSRYTLNSNGTTSTIEYNNGGRFRGVYVRCVAK